MPTAQASRAAYLCPPAPGSDFNQQRNSAPLIRATHARPLHPAALTYVSFGIVLVRVRVENIHTCSVSFGIILVRVRVRVRVENIHTCYLFLIFISYTIIFKKLFK